MIKLQYIQNLNTNRVKISRIVRRKFQEFRSNFIILSLPILDRNQPSGIKLVHASSRRNWSPSRGIDGSVTEVTPFAPPFPPRRGNEKEGHEWRTEEEKREREGGKNIKPARQNRLTRAVVRHRVGGRELDRSIGGVSGVYTSAFAELVAWDRWPMQKWLSCERSGNQSVKFATVWGEAKTDLHRSEAANGEKKREREGFEILWAVIVWLAPRRNFIHRVIISNARRREIPPIIRRFNFRDVSSCLRSHLSRRTVSFSLVTLYRGLLRFSTRLKRSVRGARGGLNRRVESLCLAVISGVGGIHRGRNSFGFEL